MKHLLLLGSCFLILFQTKALSRDADFKPINLEFIIIDTALREIDNPKLYVTISDVPIGGIEFFAVKSEQFREERIELNKSYTYKFKSTSKYMYMMISCSDPEFKRSNLGWIDNVYIIKEGSNLKCVIGEDYYKFYGNDAILANFQTRLFGLAYKYSEKDLSLREKEEFTKYIIKVEKSLDSVLLLQLNLINSNRFLLGDYFTKVLTANCYGYRYYSRLRQDDILGTFNSTYYNSMRKYYLENNIQRKRPDLIDSILVNSPLYANYLVEEMNIEEKIKNKNMTVLSDSSIGNIIIKIDSTYTGVLKDKILTVFILKTVSNVSSKGYLPIIISKVRDVKYKDILLYQQNISTEMKAFRNYSLSDTAMKIFNQDDFKDKVVVMDFWYTGCTACIRLNTAMAPVYKYFEGNNRVVFMSVSIDKDIDQWKQSVKSGKYSHLESINLFTNGEGVNHDLIDYYRIKSYPTVKVIKKGILFSALPPRPTIGVEPGFKISKGAAALIKIVDNALEKGSVN